VSLGHIVDIVGGLHQDSGGNELVAVSQDRDSSDGTTTKQF